MPEAATRVFVALGSNLGDRQQHLESAVTEIGKLNTVARLSVSSTYETDPMGPQNQPDYLNAVCVFDYTGTPRVLLTQLQAIESSHGRVKSTERWIARPLDLDILLFGDEQVKEPDLQIPHSGIADRSFVLWPLRELDSALEIPGLGLVGDLCQNCEQFGIRRFDSQPATSASL